jgi:3-hydroxyisobutyrate dehydrogenase
VEPLARTCRTPAGGRATLASSVDDLYSRARVVIVMLVDEDVTDDVLGRGTPGFA